MHEAYQRGPADGGRKDQPQESGYQVRAYSKSWLSNIEENVSWWNEISSPVESIRNMHLAKPRQIFLEQIASSSSLLIHHTSLFSACSFIPVDISTIRLLFTAYNIIFGFLFAHQLAVLLDTGNTFIIAGPQWCNPLRTPTHILLRLLLLKRPMEIGHIILEFQILLVLVYIYIYIYHVASRSPFFLTLGLTQLGS